MNDFQILQYFSLHIIFYFLYMFDEIRPRNLKWNIMYIIKWYLWFTMKYLTILTFIVLEVDKGFTIAQSYCAQSYWEHSSVAYDNNATYSCINSRSIFRSIRSERKRCRLRQHDVYWVNGNWYARSNLWCLYPYWIYHWGWEKRGGGRRQVVKEKEEMVNKTVL